MLFFSFHLFPPADIRTLYRFDKTPLGEGQYGKVYRVTELATGKVFACKSIARSTLVTVEDVEDIRAEVKILFHLQVREGDGMGR